MYCIKLIKVKKGRRYTPIELGAFRKQSEAEKAVALVLNIQKKFYNVDICRKIVYLIEDKAKVYISAGKRVTPYPPEDPVMWLYSLEKIVDEAYCKGKFD